MQKAFCSYWRTIIKKHFIGILFFAVLLGAFFLMLFSAKQDSITVDEKVHLSAGYLHVWKGDYSFNVEHPPLIDDLEGLFAKIASPRLPNVPFGNYQPYDSGQWSFASDFFYRSGNNAEKVTMWGRLPIILLFLGLIYLVFCWAKTLFGPKAGLLAAILTAFCPNLLAHGRLATTDIGLVFFFLLTLWLLRKWLLLPTLKNIFWFSLALSGTIFSKFSGVLVLPIILAAAILFIPPKKALEQIGQLLLSFLITALLGWVLYAFSMRANLGGFWDPFDKFFTGYQMVVNHNAIGHWSYFNGVVDYRGWWAYFLEVLALKVPLVVFALLGLALIFYKKISQKFFEEFFLTFPILFYLGMSLTSKIDIGIRHILLILPLVYIFVSRLATIKNKTVNLIVTILVLAQVVTAILAYPNYLSYFNPIAGGPVKASSYMADSNLDWDQNMIRFAHWAHQAGIKKVYELCWNYEAFQYYGLEPEILPNSSPRGIVVLCIQQIRVPPAGFDLSWATKYPPDKIIGGTMYIWDFTKPKN